MIYELYTNFETCLNIDNKKIVHKSGIIQNKLILIHNGKYGLLFPYCNIEYLIQQIKSKNQNEYHLLSVFSMGNQNMSPLFLVRCHFIEEKVQIVDIYSRKYLIVNTPIKPNEWLGETSLQLNEKDNSCYFLIKPFILSNIEYTKILSIFTNFVLLNPDDYLNNLADVIKYVLKLPIKIIYKYFFMCIFSQFINAKEGRNIVNNKEIDKIIDEFLADIHNEEKKIIINVQKYIKNISNVSDENATRFYNLNYSFENRINFWRKSSIEPIKNAVVITFARNEGMYLIDFCAFYKSIGFDHIIVYSNNNTDGSTELLKKLAKGKYITYINNDNSYINPQAKALYHAVYLDDEIYKYKWALICDIDEYLIYDTNLFSDINDFLNFHDLRNSDAICINWVYVGSNGKIEFEEYPDLLRFKYNQGIANHHIKSIIRPRNMTMLQIHYGENAENDALICKNAQGEIHKCKDGKFGKALSQFPSISHAVLLHYWSRSLKEFIYKHATSRCDRIRDNRPFNFFYNYSLNRDFLNYFSNINLKLNNINKYIDKLIPNFITYRKSLMEFCYPEYIKVKSQFYEELDKKVIFFKEYFRNYKDRNIIKMLTMLENRKNP